MRYCLFVCLALVVFIAACQGPPPTQIVLVVTATPTSEETQEAASTAEAQQATEEATDEATLLTPEATAEGQPTPTISQIQVAEQVFENGRMFWVQPVKQIWVMVDDGQGSGQWMIYPDNFEEGEAEFDPAIVPPEGKYQPERGFGKLWRENEAIREALGWGITPEFGFVSPYEYHLTDQVNAQNQVIGYHILSGLYGDRFQFNEADGTWKQL